MSQLNSLLLDLCLNSHKLSFVFPPHSDFSCDSNLLVYLMLFCTSLVSIGVVGIISSRQSIIRILISSEIALLGLMLGFAVVSVFTFSASGQVYFLILLVSAASESALGLALVILWYTLLQNSSVLSLSSVKS